MQLGRVALFLMFIWW